MRINFTNHKTKKAKLQQAGAFIIVLLVANLFLAKESFGQITQPIAWTKAYDQTTASGNSSSFSISGGAKRILVVTIATTFTAADGSGTQADPTTITYNGVTLTKATGNGGTNGRMHTWIYYLKDNAVMDGASHSLNVTVGAVSNATLANMTVYYAVFAGVDQAPASYTTGNNLSNSDQTTAAQLNPSMSINADEQAIYMSSIYVDGSTTIPSYLVNANWNSGGSNTGNLDPSGTSNDCSWKNEIVTRNIPGSNITDNAATGTRSPASRYAMSAMSLPKFPCPQISASATKNDVKCFATSTGQIIVSGSGGASPYTFSIDNGTNYNLTLISGGVYEGIDATSGKFKNLPIGTYQIRVKDANGCVSKSVQ